MFFYLFTCVELIILQVVADWRLVDSSFTQQAITENNWKMKDGCYDSSDTSIEYGTCNQNLLQYLRMNQDKEYLSKSFSYKSFKAQVIFDVFFDDADDSDSSYLKVTYSSDNNQEIYFRNYVKNDLIQYCSRICQSNWGRYDFNTIESIIPYSNTNKFTINICFRPRNSNMEVGIRNLLVYVNTCYPTCLTCDGPGNADCLSCYDGYSPIGGVCQCKADQQFSDTDIGCRQECSRNFSLARYDKICVQDNRIQSRFLLFSANNIPQSDQRYSPLTFLEDNFHPKNTDLVYSDCNGMDYIGKLQYSEGMIYQLNLEDAVKFIRIRITFYLLNFYQTSQIEILYNSSLYAKITMDSSDFQLENIQKIFQQTQNCDGSILIRAEMIIQLTSSNPTLTFQGQLQQENEFWGLKNITVDTGVCQQNCLICSNFSSCTQCEAGYSLFKMQCVNPCPIHSTNCLDYEDIIPYSRYLAKGFYDLNMTMDEIRTFYDTATDPSTSLSSKSKFSFLNNKIVLGGLLVWNDGSYTKTWTISKPHYGVSIYFNLTYGDGYTGAFYYKVGTTTNLFQGPYNNPGGGSNIIGRVGSESTRYFNVSLTNFYNNNLYVEFKCDVATTNITKEFCAISEYFIVVHYCPPFCSSCNSLTVCTDATYTGSNCGVSQYLDFNSSTQTYSCQNCNQPGCMLCTSGEECTQCATYNFLLTNGICQCKPSTFFQGNDCIQCNRYCENCYGISDSNCLTCVQEYHRGIQRNKCLCLPGYYDDGINLPCLPICGDELIVEEEECDDGNNNPFDGCHNCKFACNFACDICLNGKCYQCNSGYEVHNNDCRSICEENTLVLLQQCTGDSTNCVNCEYKCSLHCINCFFGICIKCDEDQGWYAQYDGTCSTICGDGIVVSLTEMCDDGNANPQDGCNYCQISCDVFCTTCINSECIACEIGYLLIENKCIPQCQDGLLVFPEQCEDGNISPYDGCFFCQFQCSQFCIDCQFGICHNCDEERGWYLQDDGSCNSFCGDNILVLENEECDDNNVNSQCKQCQTTCDKNCLQCQKGVCIQCIPGLKWEFSLQQCVSMCEDRILIEQEIVCQDGNNLLDDGCYQCQISCQQSCTLCSSRGCLECNTKGWILDEQQNKCETVCGDGIVVQYYEECDDLIDENCFRCKYNCQDSCLICHNGDCLQCKLGWQVNFDMKCYSQNADSSVVGDEQCDDYNSIMYDGCFLSQYQCQLSCLNCQFGKCIKCDDGYNIVNGKCHEILNDGRTIGNEQCDDMNLSPQDGCFNGQYDCPQHCKQCVLGQCLECYQESNQINYLNNFCFSLCGDGLVQDNEQCDDANIIQFDGCHQCEFQCNNYCETCNYGICSQCQQGYYLDAFKNTCDSICGDGIVTHDEKCDDGIQLPSKQCDNCKFLCQEQCLKCVDGECLECLQIGWEIDPINSSCQPICGDQLVLGNEQCDDGNDDVEDGCVECNFKCQVQCTLCYFGECRQCNVEGWELNKGRCTPVCGDLLVLGNEECDDGNFTDNDGCYECKFQCQSQCIDCVLGICKACSKDGWVLDENNICVNKCGDGILIELMEQCDDGNDIPYDGCYQCEFQCEELCTLCDLGICLECNQLGWVIKDNKCTSYCGDGLVIGNEQCDDMNSIQSDGCYECKFMCDQYCIDCEDGICKECPNGMHLFGYICSPKCGDGFLLQQLEDCDDGNIDNSDGCNSQCKIEKDWICINNLNSFSVCQYEKQPDFILLILHQSNEISDIRVMFTEQVKFSPLVNQNLSEYILTKILNLKNENYKIEITQETIISKDIVANLVLQFRITFLYPVELPIFEIEFLDDPIISELNQTLAKSKEKIQLASPVVLNPNQVQIAESASKFNKAIIISLASVSTVCLLTGQSDIFWNLMDQLQYLSYIKYINIEFSPNLNIFFDIFQLITISPLISVLGFQRLFDALDGSDSYVIETSNKFQKDNINAYFFQNFQSLLFCAITTYLNYSVAKILFYFLKKIDLETVLVNRFSIGKNLLQTRNRLKKQITQFYYNALFRLLLSNCYDISFACAIQMAYYPIKNDNILLINYYLSILFYLGIILAILYLITISSAFQKQSSIRNRYQYKEIFEGINEDYNIWKFQFHSFQMIKKLIFISLIVFLQDNGFIQTIGISLFQSLFLVHTILYPPLSNQFEYLKIVITESLIIFNSVSFLLYLYQNELALRSEMIINVGWLHIFTFSSIFAVTFFLDLVQQLKKLIKLIGKSLKKPESEQDPVFY